MFFFQSFSTADQAHCDPCFTWTPARVFLEQQYTVGAKRITESLLKNELGQSGKRKVRLKETLSK